MNDAFSPFQRYFEFHERSRPKEYWLFVLLLFLGWTIAPLVDLLSGLGGWVETDTVSTPDGISINKTVHGGILTWIWLVGTLCPAFAVSVRRLHDSDLSGWWVLITFTLLLNWAYAYIPVDPERPFDAIKWIALIALIQLASAIVWLVLMCRGGTRGPNRFGPDPIGTVPAQN